MWMKDEQSQIEDVLIGNHDSFQVEHRPSKTMGINDKSQEIQMTSIDITLTLKEASGQSSECPSSAKEPMRNVKRTGIRRWFSSFRERSSNNPG
jgi:hypothetical protein